MKQYILLLAFLINTISLISQENYFPPKGLWEVKTPSVFGINNEKILSAINMQRIIKMMEIMILELKY